MKVFFDHINMFQELSVFDWSINELKIVNLVTLSDYAKQQFVILTTRSLNMIIMTELHFI